VLLPLRVYYCEKRISVTYGDMPNDAGLLDGVLTDDDVVHRVGVVGGFAGHTDTGIALGDPRSEVTAAYGTDTSEHAEGGSEALGGTQDLYPRKGLAFTHSSSNAVTAMAVHNTYSGAATPTPINANLDLDSLKVGTISASLTTGSSFTTVKTQFGEPDVQGKVAIDSSTTIALLGYSNLGLRFVAYDNSGDFDANKVLQVYITPPYAGMDPSNTLNLGSVREEWVDAYETTGTEQLGGVAFEKFKVGTLFGFQDILVGVSFVDDTACAARAAIIVLNWLSL
jgi:hypothetical protein